MDTESLFKGLWPALTKSLLRFLEALALAVHPWAQEFSYNEISSIPQPIRALFSSSWALHRPWLSTPGTRSSYMAVSHLFQGQGLDKDGPIS